MKYLSILFLFGFVVFGQNLPAEWYGTQENYILANFVAFTIGAILLSSEFFQSQK